MAQPRNLGWITKVINTARSKGRPAEAVLLPQEAYDELKAKMGGSVSHPPGSPEDTVHGTRVQVDPALMLGQVRVMAGYSPIEVSPLP